LARAAAPVRRAAMNRVIIDNDFAGDPDGLFQLAHHLLCDAVDVPLVIGSHLPSGLGDLPGLSTRDAAAKAARLIAALPPGPAPYPVPVAGGRAAMASRANWSPSPATAAIVREAMREDTTVPLVYAAGAGLTELALAWLAEPRIGKRIRLVWIGGREHEGLASLPPGPDEIEFNFGIDPIAAQIVFNESDIAIWQVPRDQYRAMIFSNAEIADLAQNGPLGRLLAGEIEGMAAALEKIPGLPPMPRSDVYVLGDSPLVTLTALQTPIQPDPASSRHVTMPTPELLADGRYRPRPGARPMRVYTGIDADLTFRDMVSRFRRADAVRR